MVLTLLAVATVASYAVSTRLSFGCTFHGVGVGVQSGCLIVLPQEDDSVCGVAGASGHWGDLILLPLFDSIISALLIPLWIPLLLFTPYPTVAFIRGPVRRWRRRRRGECVGCGYNLTGNESGVCPECGKPI